jgi:hypothetical protein
MYVSIYLVEIAPQPYSESILDCLRLRLYPRRHAAPKDEQGSFSLQHSTPINLEVSCFVLVQREDGTLEASPFEAAEVLAAETCARKKYDTGVWSVSVLPMV